MKFSASLAAAAFAGGLMLSGAALAQDQSSSDASAQQAAAPAAPAAPTDVKAIGDWTVRCFPVASVSPCDMYEELDDKTSRQRVVGVSIAYVPDGDRHVAQIAVPLGVAIAAGAVIKTDSFTSPKLPFRRCDRSGCYIEMVLPNDMIDQLNRGGANATVNIVADDGKPYALRFSLNGFSSAHDAMSALAKQKASKVPAAAAPSK